MKRICVFTHIFPARSETFVKEHVLGLARRGHRVTVLAREIGDGIAPDELEAIDGAGVERVYLRRFKVPSVRISRILNRIRIALLAVSKPDLFSLFRHPEPWTTSELLLACKAAAYISGNDFDLVHVHFGTLGARLQRVASHYRHVPPLIVTWHGYDANAIPASRGLDVYRALFDSDVRHTVGSAFMERRLLSLGAHEDRVSLIPMGIDVGRFTYRKRERSAAEPLKIVSVGRLDEVKGYRYLIDAIRQVVARGRCVKLRIVGDGPLRKALEAQIAASDLGDHVTLVGALPSGRVIDELNGAHLFALTGVVAPGGKAEAQGVVFAEAQATGLPVIACDVGGTADSLVDGETGYLCAPGDVDAVAEAIERFEKDRELRERFGVNGRDFVEKNLSMEMMLDRFAGVYRGLSRH